MKPLTARPVLKWAGGKGQLIRQIQAHLPPQITRYAEPFVGSGALFFYIAQTYQPQDLYISDRNPDLILLYQVIQSSVESLISVLSAMQAEFYSYSHEQQRAYFYQVRSAFNTNQEVSDFAPQRKLTAKIERASQVVFLNRTCFNGLFRVNAQGKFNVPFGDYKNPKICDRTNLIAVSQILQSTTIKLADFSECLSFCRPSTFVYFDPPYRPLSKTANFNAYAKDSFADAEQKRLAQFCDQLDSCGVQWLLSNSDPHNTDRNDQFFDDLYADFQITRVKASRMINAIASKRKEISEILIKNYS